MKAWAIAQRLIAQNRWLYLFLVLWPLLMALVLLLPSNPPLPEDVISILHQESLYGLALVIFSGSIQLGNEERSRRVVSVLSRAVTRRQYLLSLCMAAWLPLIFYAASLLLSAVILSANWIRFAWTLMAMLLIGLWAATVAVFFAAWLPSILASMASLLLLSTMAFVAADLPYLGFSQLLRAVTRDGGDPPPDLAGMTGRALLSGGITAVILAGVFFAAAVFIFERRDLRLKLD